MQSHPVATSLGSKKLCPVKIFDYIHVIIHMYINFIGLVWVGTLKVHLCSTACYHYTPTVLVRLLCNVFLIQ